MFDKKTYKDYLMYCRKHFNGTLWIYEIEDAYGELLDIMEIIDQDLMEVHFSMVNIDL